MPGSTGKRLSDLLRTKDPEMIKEAMTSMVAEQADIVEDKLATYKQTKEDDGSLSKEITALFKNADALHKVVSAEGKQPGAIPGGQAALPTSQGIAAIGSGDPRHAAAVIYRELQEQNPGVEITDDMLQARIMQYQQKILAPGQSIIDV